MVKGRKRVVHLRNKVALKRLAKGLEKVSEPKPTAPKPKSKYRYSYRPYRRHVHGPKPIPPEKLEFTRNLFSHVLPVLEVSKHEARVKRLHDSLENVYVGYHFRTYGRLMRYAAKKMRVRSGDLYNTAIREYLQKLGLVDDRGHPIPGFFKKSDSAEYGTFAASNSEEKKA